jgi:hypothetical protein
LGTDLNEGVCPLLPQRPATDAATCGSRLIDRARAPDQTRTINRNDEDNMSDLFEKAIAAHGGWERWQTVTKLAAHVSIGGGLWAAKGKGGILDDVRVEIDPHLQHVEYSPFGASGRHSVYEPNRAALVMDKGSLIESRNDPRAAFSSHVRETQWDDLDLIYFSGYAMWTYLTTPFLFRLPGFESEEINPWHENGEEWRRLKVIFPASVPSHSTEQIFYFDETGILRRHDYSADVLGGLPSANYASEPKEFGGLVVPTKRRVFARRPDNHPAPDRIAVAIDIHDIKVS